MSYLLSFRCEKCGLLTPTMDTMETWFYCPEKGTWIVGHRKPFLISDHYSAPGQQGDRLHNANKVNFTSGISCPMCRLKMVPSDEITHVFRTREVVCELKVGDFVHAYYREDGNGPLHVVDVNDKSGIIRDGPDMRNHGGTLLLCRVAEINQRCVVLEFIELGERKIINKTAQQVDSAEASTIAVPPSEPSGSPR